MTWHWWHVVLSWGVVLAGFVGVTAAIAARARAAKRRLAVLERR
jgi:hypothetical protein